MFSFSGFGTAGLAKTNNDRAEYAMPGQLSGADDSVEGSVDTKLGLQLTAKFNPMFSATAQLLTKYNGKGNWEPNAEWAYFKAQFSPNWALRVGRMGLPAFAVSDFRDVGYSNLWVRPPLDVYGQVSLSNFEGADITYRTQMLGANVTAQAFAGRMRTTFRQIKLDGDDSFGFNLTAEYDNGLTIRLGHLESDLTVHFGSLDALVAGLRTASAQVPQAASVADQISAKGKLGTFSGVGLSYDQDNWILSAEYTWRRTETYISNTTGWYASAGYRVGNFTPYVVASELKLDSPHVKNTLPVTNVPSLEALRLGVNGVLAGQNVAQKTSAVGVRWDAYRNTAVKAQLERIRPQGGNGLFVNVKPGFSGATVLSLTVDFVF
ncbi:hypothetical protein HNQ51_003321 [Inhella inkyongensis]|uniref:Porin domain-containing protein n=1 Tax=Inhella inkyongensis TaxID=392593 RepID=A0A840SCB4_9BURK|nr:hypothetical protein [Inhella inkyongensis]MBB5205990.1 hypothetical protein [Inhella inkyongensis]